MFSRFAPVLLCVALVGPGAAALTGSGDSTPGLLETIPPVFNALSANPPQALPGEEVTITFSASEALTAPPLVLVNGQAAALSGVAGLDYVFTYTVYNNEATGPAQIEVSGADTRGNAAIRSELTILEILGGALPLSAWPLFVTVLLIALAALQPRLRKRCMLFVLLALPLPALAQPIVSNVAFIQQSDGAGASEVLITYDLASSNGNSAVSVLVSGDGGTSFDIVPASLSGEVGPDIAPGTGKQIAWAVSADLEDISIPNAVVRVLADDGACGACVSWSDPDTWGGAVPGPGDEVVIPADLHVLLDEDTPPLGGVMVNGTLEFARADLALTAEWIMVHGTLQIGSEASPFTHQAVITLTGDDPEESVMDMGTRGIMVMGGALELHGAPPAVPWTKIGAHAAAGASLLQLMQAVTWNAGDEIVVAPTDFYGVSMTEHFTLAAASGNQLELTGALAAPRWGLLQYATSSGMSLTPDGSIVPPVADTPLVLDERAEVANLTRNIVIQAPDDTLWQTEGFGAHVMVMDTGGTAHINGVEFRRGGQRGRLGRYPFHWHRLSYDATTFLGDATGQYIRNSAINRSANRGIVIHATNGVTVEDNILYDVRGHALFTEDAVERRNTITGNLALYVRDPAPGDALKQHEFNNGGPAGGSSGFWVANPDNIVTNNTAADCQGFGFWLAFPNNPWGLSIGVVMRPNRLLFGEFDHNTAHTSGFDGLMFDNVEIDNAGNVQPFQYQSTTDGQEPAWNSGTLRRFALSRFTAWKNRRGGIWDRVAWPDITGTVSADNCGRYFAGSGADGLIEGCLIVGTSLNNATPRPSLNFPDTLGGDETPTAFATYHSAFDMRNNVIVNFPLDPGNRSGAFATEDYYIRPVDKGQMRNPGNLFIDTHPGYRSGPVFDHYVLSGALWDAHGVWGPAGHYFVYDDPFFTYGQTVAPVEPAGQTGGVSVPGPFYGVLEFVINNQRPYYEPLMALLATRLDPDTLAAVGTWTVDEALALDWLLAPMRHFAAHRDGIYRLEFPGHDMPTDLEIRVENMLETTDTLVLGVQFDGDTTPDAVYVQSPGTVRGYTEVASLQEVRDSSGETWWQDIANDLVWVKLQGGHWQFWDLTGEEAIPTSDELLYEKVVLHVNTD